MSYYQASPGILGERVRTSELAVRGLEDHPTPSRAGLPLVDADRLAEDRDADVFGDVQTDQAGQDPVAEDPDVDEDATRQTEQAHAEIEPFRSFHGLIMSNAPSVGQMVVGVHQVRSVPLALGV